MADVCGAPPDPFEYSLKGAVARLDTLIDQLTATVSPPYVIPLSGGWDSRLILAVLRERTDKIVTITLGCPGQLDYELGGRVTEAAQVDHLPVRLDQRPVEWTEPRNSARSAP
jgi:asparagine synthetase B (glutamine-hydrolysing)